MAVRHSNIARRGRHVTASRAMRTTSCVAAFCLVASIGTSAQERVEVTTASGFSAQNQRPLHYGLGQARAVDRVVIRWPSGASQTIANPAVDMRHHVREPDGE